MSLVYLGLGALGAAFLRKIHFFSSFFFLSNGEKQFFVFLVIEVACWMITGERQAARIRSLYLKTILRQDIGFFDVETNTGEVVGRMSGDTVLIQDAMGEKVMQWI